MKPTKRPASARGRFMYSPITHQRITVAPWLWEERPREAAKFSALANTLVPAAGPQPPDAPLASRRASQSVVPVHTRRARPTMTHDRGPSPSPLLPSMPRALRNGLPGQARPAQARPGSARAGLARAEQNGAPRQDGVAPAAAYSRSLRYRDPLLLIKLGEKEVQLMLVHESRMMSSRERRERCLSSLKALLHAQQSNRDRVHAHGAGREDLRHALVSAARTSLAAVLGELRLATASVVLTTHAWRTDIVELGTRACWPPAELSAILGRLDADVWHPLVGTLLHQLDFAPLPSGTDPFLLRWFGPGIPSWWAEIILAPLGQPAGASVGVSCEPLAAQHSAPEAALLEPCDATAASATSLPSELPPPVKVDAGESQLYLAQQLGYAHAMPTQVRGNDPNVPRVLVATQSSSAGNTCDAISTAGHGGRSSSSRPGSARSTGSSKDRVCAGRDVPSTPNVAAVEALACEARKFADAVLATAPDPASDVGARAAADSAAIAGGDGGCTSQEMIVEPGNLALTLRKRRIAAGCAPGIGGLSTDPLGLCRQLYDASQRHSAHELALIRRAAAVLVATNMHSATCDVVKKVARAATEDAHSALSTLDFQGSLDGSGTEDASSDEQSDSSSLSSSGSETGDDVADASEAVASGSLHMRDAPLHQAAHAPMAIAAHTLGPAARDMRHQARTSVEAQAHGSDEMPEGSCDLLWGWKPNNVGVEMARLLYSHSGSADGVARYDAVLTRYRKVLQFRRETRCAITIQRRVRGMLADWARQRVKRDNLRKYAAMRAIVKLQGRVRGRRLRREEAAMQAELNEKAARRKGTLAIQRAWRDEGMRRALFSQEVAEILGSATAFLKAWQSLVPGVVESEDGAERAQARWKNVRSLNMTVALSVCSMLRQRVRAAATIQGANRRMLGARHRAYFFAVASLKRMLRRAIKSYILRRDERDAARAYSWIERTESVLLIQRTYRAYAASLHTARISHQSLEPQDIATETTHTSPAHDAPLCPYACVRPASEESTLWVPFCCQLRCTKSLIVSLVIGVGPLKDQKRNLLEQLHKLARAREIRGKAGRQRDAARRKLHLIEGKRAICAQLAGRPDQRLSLVADDLAAEVRKQSAKAGRIQQAIDDIAGAAPRSRGGSRSLCDRCEGALLVVAQLAHIGASWRGASGPDVQLDGGLAMTMQLLRTRHERLQDAAKEEDARLSAHEKLTNQLANVEGGLRILEMLLEEARTGAAANFEGEAGSVGGSIIDDPAGAAMERLSHLQEEAAVVEGMLERLNGEVAELEQADHAFEQVCGGVALIDSAIDTLGGSQRSLLEAIRLQAFARRLQLLPSRATILAQRQWLRELSAWEIAFEELRRRKLGVETVEQELHVSMIVESKNDLEASNLQLTMAEELTIRRLNADIATWGGVPNHEEELLLELRPKSKQQISNASADGGGAESGPGNGGTKRGLFTFILTVSVGWATRELLQRLQAPGSVASLSAALHRFVEHIGQPAKLKSMTFGPHTAVRPPSLAIALRKSRGGIKLLTEQLNRRQAYDERCVELPPDSCAKQRNVASTSWEWCRGAMRAMRLLLRSEVLHPSGELEAALATSHAMPRRRYASFDHNDPKAAVELACAAPTPPPHMTPHQAEAKDCKTGTWRSSVHEHSDKHSSGHQPPFGEVAVAPVVDDSWLPSQVGASAVQSAEAGAEADAEDRTMATGKHRKRGRHRRKSRERSKKSSRMAAEVVDGADTRDGPSHGGAAETSMATAAVDIQPPEKHDTNKGFWRELRHVIRGRISLERSSSSHETRVGTAEHAAELCKITKLRWEQSGRVKVAKEYRRRLKDALALELARQRLIIHMATLSEPTLKPQKAIEAADRRRLLKEPEFPDITYASVGAELYAARAALSTAFPAAMVRDDMAYEQAVLVCSAVSGAMWAICGSTKQQAAEAAQRDTQRPLLPAGMTPAMAKRANDTELPDVRRLRATFLALLSSAVASASVIAEAALLASRQLSKEDATRLQLRSGSSAACMSVPEQPTALFGNKTEAEACSMMRLFPAYRTTPSIPDAHDADANIAVEAFLDALHIQSTARPVGTKEGRKARGLLRMPPHVDYTGLGSTSAAAPSGTTTASVPPTPPLADRVASTTSSLGPAHTLGATPAMVSSQSRSSRFFAQLSRTMVLATRQSTAEPTELHTVLSELGKARGEASAKVAELAVDKRIAELVSRPADWYEQRVTEHGLRKCALSLGLPIELQGHGCGPLDRATLPLLVNEASGSLHVIPLVLMTMRAPLPPGWISRRGGMRDPAQGMVVTSTTADSVGGSQQYEEFVHVASGKILPFHPLLHTFRRLVAGELRRKRGSRFATFSCHEWILMAVDRQGGSGISGRGRQSAVTVTPGPDCGLEPMWINLLSGKRCPEFPVLSAPHDAVFTRKNGWSEQKRAVKSFYDLTTLRQMIGKVPSARTMRERSRDARARALAHRPLTMYEVLYAAEVIGIDPFEHPELMFLAEEATCLELPLGWDAVETMPDEERPEGSTFYLNSILQISQWLHPKLTYLISLARTYGAPDADGSEDIEKD